MTDLAEECNRLNAELSKLQSQHTNLVKAIQDRIETLEKYGIEYGEDAHCFSLRTELRNLLERTKA